MEHSLRTLANARMRRPLTALSLGTILRGTLGPLQTGATSFDFTIGTDRYISALGAYDPTLAWNCLTSSSSWPPQCDFEVVDAAEAGTGYFGGFDLNTMPFFDVYELDRRIQDDYVGAERTKVINSLSVVIRVKDDDNAWYDIGERAVVAAGDCRWGPFEVDGDTKTCNRDAYVQSADYADWCNCVMYGALSWLVGDFEIDYVRVLGDYTAVGPPAPVPGPGTLALLGIGLAGLGLSRRRKTH